MKRIINIFEIILFICFLILILFFKDYFSIILFIPIFILIVLFTKHIKVKRFGLFIFCISLIIRLVSVLVLDVSNVDDFKTMFLASQSLINGDLSFLKSNYFILFSYQLGHVLYQAFLLNIINNITFLKVINSIICSFIVLFIYLISRSLFNERIGRISSLIYLFFLYPIYLTNVLTNQHLSVLLVLIGIYLLIRYDISYKLIIGIGILLSLSNVFRTEGIIYIISICIYFICTKKKFRYVFILIASYLLCNICINGVIYLSPLHTTLKNNEPLWKFYCGLSYKHNGIYNEEDESVYFNSHDKKSLLKSRVKSDYKKFPILFLKKEKILWTDANYDLRINNMSSGLYNFLTYFNQGCLNFILLLFIIGLFPKRKGEDSKILLIKIMLGLYYIVYMFIEVSPRYAYNLDILIMLIIGVGVERVLNIKKQRSLL